MRKLLFALTFSLLAASLYSCGYTMGGSGAMSGDTAGVYHSIAVPLFTNDTYEPLIERAVTSALKEEVAYNGRLMLVESEEADLVVTGRVAQFILEPLTYDAAERIQEYRLIIVSEVKVRDASKDEVVWKETKMEAFSDYRVTQDTTKSKINKNEAIKKASRNLAEEFVIKVLDIL